MSTYAISDIHGACDEFFRLLDRIRFRYEGSDSLYLLGDFGDWGAKSMETIQAVKTLDETYEFVHCLIGNHELMFLEAIEGGIEGDEANDAAVNWLINNHGLVTWNAYEALSAQSQADLHRWLRALPCSYDVSVGGRRIMLAHAYPYYYDVEYTPEETARHRHEAVWRRLMLHEDPFASYTGPKHYDGFICGHTITDHYYQEQYLDQDPSVMDSVMNSVKSAVPGEGNLIFHGDKFIDIDCGAKCMALAEENSGWMQSVLRSLLERSQLSAYCLETGEEFYVSRPLAFVGDAMEGNMAPAMHMPEVDPVETPEPVRRAVEMSRRAGNKAAKTGKRVLAAVPGRWEPERLGSSKMSLKMGTAEMVAGSGESGAGDLPRGFGKLDADGSAIPPLPQGYVKYPEREAPQLRIPDRVLRRMENRKS